MNLLDHLEKLKYFYMLYGYKSFKEASKNIGITQMGLSKNISILEDILNTKLFIRNQNGIRVTPDGEKLYQFSSKLIEDSLKFQTAISKPKLDSNQITLNLETYDSIAVYFIPELFEYLNNYYPNISINVKIDHSRNIIEKINRKEIDLAIGVNLKTSLKDFHIHKLFTDQFSCYSSSQYKAELKAAQFIYHPRATDQNGKYCHEFISKYLKNHTSVKSENFETIKALTLKSVGIGILPRNVAADEVKMGRLLPISLPKIPQSFGTHKICLAYSLTLLKSNSELIYEMIRIGNAWSNKSAKHLSPQNMK